MRRSRNQKLSRAIVRCAIFRAKQFANETFLRLRRMQSCIEVSLECIFLLTLFSSHLIYGSHCDLFWIANFDVRENHSMKNATKKAAKKAPAKKAPAKKKK